MGYYGIMREQDNVREETLPRQHRGATPGYSQDAAQPPSEPLALHRQRRLPHLKQAATIALLIAILVAASTLVALLTYWIGH